MFELSTCLARHAHIYITHERTTHCLALQCYVLLQLESLHIRVDRAGQSAHGGAGGSVVYERNRTVFVGNLPFDVEVRERCIACTPADPLHCAPQSCNARLLVHELRFFALGSVSCSNIAAW